MHWNSRSFMSDYSRQHGLYTIENTCGTAATTTTPPVSSDFHFKTEPRLSSRQVCDKCLFVTLPMSGLWRLCTCSIKVSGASRSGYARRMARFLPQLASFAAANRLMACDQACKSLESRLFPSTWAVVCETRCIQITTEESRSCTQSWSQAVNNTA
jgi:hypothetical protein